MISQTIVSAIAAALGAAGLPAAASGGVGLEISTLATPAGSSIEVVARVSPPGPKCVIHVTRDGRPYRSRELRPQRSTAGVARWRWTVGQPGGTFGINVRCGRAGSARAEIAVWSA